LEVVDRRSVDVRRRHRQVVGVSSPIENPPGVDFIKTFFFFVTDAPDIGQLTPARLSGPVQIFPSNARSLPHKYNRKDAIEKRASLVISDAKSFKILTLGVNFLEPFFFSSPLKLQAKDR
jgi:hypothetical protein